MSAPLSHPGPRDALDGIFHALADQTRRAILQELASGTRSVSELVKLFSISQPAVSKHLVVLEDAGLISRGRDGKLRPCTLRAEPLRTATDWLSSYRQFWEQSFDRLEAYVAELQAVVVIVDPTTPDSTSTSTDSTREKP